METAGMSKITLQLPDKAEPTVLDCQMNGNAFSITVDDTVYEGTLMVTSPGEGWVNYQGRILPFYMTQKQDTLNIWVDGKTYHLPMVNTGARRAGGSANAPLQAGEVKAPMPGTVLKVLVKPGDNVEAGQPLVIMESMKMEMTLSAPAAATVKEVLCSEGQLVEMGALLVKLDS